MSSGGKEGILSEQLYAGLCDTMFQSAAYLCEQFLQVK